MSDYLAELKSEGYESLRSQHYNKTDAAFPAIGSQPTAADLDMLLVDSMDQNIDNNETSEQSNLANTLDTPTVPLKDLEDTADTDSKPNNKETEQQTPSPAPPRYSGESNTGNPDDSTLNDKVTEQLSTASPAPTNVSEKSNSDSLVDPTLDEKTTEKQQEPSPKDYSSQLPACPKYNCRVC